MKSSPAFTLTELLITMGLVSATLLTLSASWLYAQQTAAQTHQIEMTEQILNNTTEEILAHQKTWNSGMLEDWQKEASTYLPNSRLTINANNLRIEWPSQKAINIQCEENKVHQGCIARQL